jgi:FlaA1/EpsC-like NDP-sugar epimerase
MTRFVLTQKEAMDFLLKAMELSKGGEIFVPQMPVLRVIDLVDVLLEEYAPKVGQSPEKIDVQYIGTKSGEKLYEELMTEDESSRCVKIDWIYAILPQLKELAHIDVSSYPDARAVDSVVLKSKDYKPISKEEIKEILVSNQLI